MAFCQAELGCTGVVVGDVIPEAEVGSIHDTFDRGIFCWMFQTIPYWVRLVDPAPAANVVPWLVSWQNAREICKRLIEVKEIDFQRQIGREPIEEIRCISPKQTVPIDDHWATKAGASWELQRVNSL